MKKSFFLIIILIASFSMAQNKFDYESKWKEIEKQEADGLLKSTSSSVNSIYNQAKKDKNTQQIIRALLYQSKIAIITSDDEDIEIQIVDNFEKEINEAKGVEKSVLQSMLAELFQQYYRQHQWEINERTETEDSTGNDFRFWTESVFQKKSSDLYLKSIENQKDLQKEPIANWHYILNKVDETESLRPTLYDLLAHRAIDFFQTENNYYYGSNYNENDELVKKEWTKVILTNLCRFHSLMENKDASLYNQLELLKIETNDTSSDEFLVGLTDLSTKYPTSNYTSYILFEMANFYLNKSANEEANSFAEKKNWTEKALSVLNEIQTKFPNSAILKDAESLQKQILTPDFEIQIEKYISPDLNTPMAISHKNLDKLYFKVLKFTEDSKALNEFQNAAKKDKQQKLNAIFQAYPPENEFQLNLKTFDDYQQHSTLAKLDALKSGRYLILVSNNADFQLNENVQLKYYNLDVTAYSIVFRNNEILVTERESGKPVSKKVNVYETKSNKESKLKTLTTNEFGLADINFSNDNYRNLKFKIDGEEVSYQNNYYRNYNKNQEETDTYHTKFFTDRAIYRPGQTVYFKAIAYKESPDGKRNVVTNNAIEITLYDVNDEEISTLELKTNEFGSVSGEFVLPSTGLT